MAFRTNKTPDLQEKSASGSVATFNTALAMPLVECKTEFMCTQEAGTPSPSNPLAITGVDDITLTVNGNGVVIDLDGTRYGGYVNVVEKKGYITFVSALISSFTFQQASASSGYFRVETVSSYAKPVESTVVANILCEALPTKSNTTTWLGNTGISVNNTGRIVLTDSSCTTYEEYHNKYDSFRVVYELKTPIEIDLSDIPTLSTIIGDNTIFADTGDIDLTFKDLDIAKRGNFREVFKLPS